MGGAAAGGGAVGCGVAGGEAAGARAGRACARIYYYHHYYYYYHYLVYNYVGRFIGRYGFGQYLYYTFLTYHGMSRSGQHFVCAYNNDDVCGKAFLGSWTSTNSPRHRNSTRWWPRAAVNLLAEKLE